MKGQRLLKGAINRLSPPFAKLTIDSIFIHSTMKGARVMQGVRIQHQKAGLLGMRNRYPGLIPYDFKDVPNAQ